MLDILRFFSLRPWRGRIPSRKVRSEIETLKRWARRSADDRYFREN